jgi:hypothetical protein
MNNCAACEAYRMEEISYYCPDCSIGDEYDGTRIPDMEELQSMGVEWDDNDEENYKFDSLVEEMEERMYDEL